MQWSATQNFSGTIELVQNGNVVASKTASVTSTSPATLSATINFPKSGWLVARRDATGGGDHYVHTAAVFVTVGNAPVRASAVRCPVLRRLDEQFAAQYFGRRTVELFFPDPTCAAQARYQTAKSLFQQIVAEANGAAVDSLVNRRFASKQKHSCRDRTVVHGFGNLFGRKPEYYCASAMDIVESDGGHGQPARAGHGSGLGTATITATLNGISGSTTLSVQTNPLTITTQSLPNGTVGTSYTTTLAASGGTTPYTWSISGGALPGGLTLNGSTGNISGTPTAAGTFNLTARVTDSGSPQASATAPFTITISSSGTVNLPMHNLAQHHTAWNPGFWTGLIS